MNNKRKGQTTIIGVFLTFMTMVAYFSLRPALISTINSANLTAGSPEQIVAGLIDFFFIAAILIGFLFYVFPQRQQGQY